MATILRRDAAPANDSAPAYGVLICEPAQPFHPWTEQSIPRQWAERRWAWECWLSRERACEQAAIYNRRALAHGWRTWAIVCVDLAVVELARCDVSAKTDDVSVRTRTWPSPFDTESSSRIKLDVDVQLSRNIEPAYKADARQAVLRALRRAIRELTNLPPDEWKPVRP